MKKGLLGLAGCIVFLSVIVLFRPSGPFGNDFGDYSFPDTRNARQVVMVLDAYAVDHGGHYPDGHSSTEIFQKLMDEKYVTDSSIFYRVIPGEISPNTPQLKAADICWDLTLVPIDPAGPRIPLVYTTGFKIDFKPRGSATSLKPFSPSFNLAFAHWWDSAKNPTEHITMAYSDNSSTNVPLTREGTAPNIIPADFDPKGKTYHQLTPDGELPP